MTINQVLSILSPVLLTVLTALLGYIGKEVVKLIPIAIEFVAAKIGFTRYAQAKAFGWDIWNGIEEQARLHPIIGDTIQAKILQFETAIKQKVPGITDADIESIRQAIAGEFNKDKPLIAEAVKEAEIHAETVVIQPKKVYVAEDGITELVPKLPSIADATATNDSININTPTGVNTASTNLSQDIQPLQ